VTPTPPQAPDGYRLVRELASRPRSWVYLAMNPAGRWCCLKLQQAIHPGVLSDLQTLRTRIAGPERPPGIVVLSATGVDAVSGTLWEEMPLADDAGSGRPFDPNRVDLYVPSTLALRVMMQGAASTLQVLDWGRTLAGALAFLHRAGLQHRDVKPANVLFIGGQPVLGDLGSLGSGEEPVQFPGTEGYMPPDGTGSPAVDVFALGRSLYECWTGNDRFQFPSLPRGVVESDDWGRVGWRLNTVLLRASDPRPSRRISTAEALLGQLDWAMQGGRQWSRRDVIRGGVGLGVVAGAAYLWRSLPRYRAVWERLPPQRFGMETWIGSPQTCDWSRRRVYSLASNDRIGLAFLSVSLDTWERTSLEWKGYPKVVVSARDPVSGMIWGVESHSGDLIRVNPESSTLDQPGVQLVNDSRFTGPCYWNPHHGRFGRFDGYGDMGVSLGRREWNPISGQWLRIEESSVLPMPRAGLVTFPGRGWNSWYLFGGSGNRSGRQGQRDPDLPDFDGNWHPLDDLWELDLQANRWRECFPVGRWRQPRISKAVYHPMLDCVVLLQLTPSGSGAGPTFWTWDREAVGELPRRVLQVSDAGPVFVCSTFLAEPERPDLLLLTNQGVFRVTLKPV
jgi:hypothetical protein